MPAPVAVVPALPVHAAGVDRHDNNGSDDSPSGGVGPKVNARLDKAIADVRKRAGIPGAVLGLWMPGKESFVRATGGANTATRRPMAVDSHIRIGSETTTFTVTALLQFVDQHRVKLDDPISAYVPGVRNGDRCTHRSAPR
ncbi:serine hydrolase domain-containing protein [Streptomyces sp. NBC_01003]|uniref:serine hydrolase domain-containing protein n=1 Tax=Streptomyces sp. NBC_01003 TaxID=2903714 RepID=UPI00386CC722